MLRKALIGAVVAGALAGCSRDNELRCEPAERYSGAQSVPPVRVPEDLTVPDETDSLRLPPPATQASSAAGRCLESPPDFFENRGAEEPEAPAPAAPDPEEDPERRIDN